MDKGFLIFGQHWEAKCVQFIIISNRSGQSFAKFLCWGKKNEWRRVWANFPCKYGIDRYLKENNHHVSIIRAVLEAKCKNLREHGKGKRPNKSNSLSESEVNILWECGQLGTHSPMSLIDTIWWLFTLHFGLKGRQKHHSMTVSDFQFKKDDFGNEFVTSAVRITKTRQSDLHEKHRLIQPKMFSTDTSRCPVNIFKLYLSKRPSQLRSSGPLYLSIIHKPVSNSLWYKNVPMGQHTLHYEKNDRKFSRSNSLKEKV